MDGMTEYSNIPLQLALLWDNNRELANRGLNEKSLHCIVLTLVEDSAGLR